VIMSKTRKRVSLASAAQSSATSGPPRPPHIWYVRYFNIVRTNVYLTTNTYHHLMDASQSQ